MAWISSNKPLAQADIDNNAKEVYNFFQPRGWSLNAIAGMLGNMWRESTVNPGVWQNYKVNYNMGYGLVQWTPAKKVTDWLKANGYPIGSGLGQCQRIIYEKVNNIQYYPTKAYNLSFDAFSKSKNSVAWLVRAFFYNYERAAESTADIPGRIKWGEYFYKLLGDSSEEPPESPMPDPEKPEDPGFTPAYRGYSRRQKMMIMDKRR